MSLKKSVIDELQLLSESMIQGSLSETTRQCGQPTCACAHDSSKRHGPHLYFHYKTDGKVRTAYVPAAQSVQLKDARGAWDRFQEIALQLSADNRERFLQRLQKAKSR